MHQGNGASEKTKRANERDITYEYAQLQGKDSP